MSDTEKCPWCECVLVDDECPTDDCRDCISYFNNLFPNEQRWVNRKVRDAVDAEREWCRKMIYDLLVSVAVENRDDENLARSLVAASMTISTVIEARNESSRRQPVDK